MQEGTNHFKFTTALKNVVAFEVVHTGVADYGAAVNTESAFWSSSALAYWVEPKNTIDGQQSVLFHVSPSAGVVGLEPKEVKFFPGRDNDLFSIDITVTNALNMLYTIAPANPLILVLKIYTLKAYATK